MLDLRVDLCACLLYASCEPVPLSHSKYDVASPNGSAEYDAVKGYVERRTAGAVSVTWGRSCFAAGA